MNLHRLLACAAVLLSAENARAQACCSGSSADQFGIVARGSLALVGLRMTQEILPWTTNSEGEVSHTPQSSVLDSTATLGGGVRLLSRRFQIHGALPFRYQYRRIGDFTDSAVGLGDGSLTARFAVLEDETEGLLTTGNWVPFVEPSLGVSFPTGRSTLNAETVTQADVMGTGDYRVILGLRTSRFISEQDLVFLGGTFTRPFERPVDGAVADNFRAGELFSARVSYLKYLNLFWSVGGGVEYRASLGAHLDGVEVENSETRQLLLGAQVSYFFSWPSFQLRAGVNVEPPIDGVAKNIPWSGVGVGLSLERHFGYDDY